MAPEHDHFVTRNEFQTFASGLNEVLGRIERNQRVQADELKTLAIQAGSVGSLSGKTLLGMGGLVVSTVSVAVTIIAVIGAMALYPVRSDTHDNETRIMELRAVVDRDHDRIVRNEERWRLYESDLLVRKGEQ